MKMGKPTGFKEIVRELPNRRPIELRILDWEEVYHDFPEDRVDDEEFTWREVAPILVIEIVSPDSGDKDFYRNVTLYEMEPSIREYWIIDPRDGFKRRTVKVYRRRGAKWQKPITVGPGDEYTTKLLPDFCLRIEPLT